MNILSILLSPRPGCHSEVDKCAMNEIESEAIEKNMQSFKYAWVLDKLQLERKKGITMDITLEKFETPKYRCTIIDAPGHRDYIKNMIIGTSQADCAVLIIDSTKVSSEAGLSDDGQTREHAVLAFALGVKQVICCCNKMDATSPPYSNNSYNRIVTEVSSYYKKVGYKKLETIKFIPISGFQGDNRIERSTNIAWYKGPTLSEAFDQIIEPNRPSGEPLRLPLRGGCRVANSDTVAVNGCVASGIIKPKMFVHIGPTGMIRQVQALEMETDNKAVQDVHPGDNVILFFSAMHVAPCNLSCGYVVSDLEDRPVMQAISFTSQVLIINGPGEIRNGYTATMHCHTACVPVKFDTLVSKFHRSSELLAEEKPKCLKKGDVGTVKMIPTEPIVVDTFSASPALGRFVAYDQGHLVAMGVIKDVEWKRT